MLTEARDLADELGNTELRAEAMSWRVPTFVMLGDLESARREVAGLARGRRAHGTAVHAPRRRALRLGDRARRRAPRGGRGSGEARPNEWSRLLTGRDATGVHGIQMFSVVREQGRLAQLAPVIRMLAAGGRRSGPWGPGLVSVLVELGMEDEARARAARGSPPTGLDPLRESLWLASLTYLTDACAVLGDAEMAALVYPELEPLAGGTVMIGHLVAYYGAADRYLGHARHHAGRARARRGRTSSGAWSSTAAWARRRGSPTPPTSTRGCCARPGRRARARRRCCWPRPRRSPSGSGWRALLARIDALGAASRAALPDDLSPREAEVLQPRRPRAQQSRDRRRPVHQRAHGRQPHPQHPAQDRVREPHRGGLVRPPPWPGRGPARGAVGSAPCRST